MTTKNTDTHLHDKGYKQFFYNKEALYDLIINQLHPHWAHKLNYANLKPLDPSGLTPSFKAKQSDLFYETTIDGQEIIFYILLEFQSTIDYTMPYRILTYMYLQWERYFQNIDTELSPKDIRLPVIIPIVLYNGKSKWNAPLEFKQLYHNSELFGNSILNFKYDILDVNNNYSREELLSNPHLTSVLFLFDQKTKAKELLSRAYDVAPDFQKWADTTQKILVDWLRSTQHPKYCQMILY